MPSASDSQFLEWVHGGDALPARALIQRKPIAGSSQLKFPSMCLLMVLMGVNMSLGATKIHVGMNLFGNNNGYEIGINQTVLELGSVEFETGVKASFITDEYRVLLKKSPPTDIVYYEKQRIFYASVPLDALILYRWKDYSPFFKFRNQVDALVLRRAIRVENENLYHNRMRESRWMLWSGGCLGSTFKILDQRFQADVGLIFGLTPFKTGAVGTEQRIGTLNFNLAYFILDK
jgi:hypothetical protein